MRFRCVLLPVLLLALAGCGGSTTTLSETGTAASSADEATIVGHVSVPGTKGSVLVFAYAGGPGDLANREPLSVATLEQDGGFMLVIPPADGVILAFLADGSNDGVIDGGDPVVVLSDPKLAQLLSGDAAQLTDVALNFTGRTAVAASIEVRRAGAPAEATVTPTALPAS